MAPTEEDQLPAQLPAVVQDSSNAMYMHPSESVGSSITPVVFDGTGYQSWRRGILRALSVKNKTCFINGKIPKPNFTSPAFAHWEKCDNMELWDEPEDKHDQANDAKLYQIQQEISNLTQGNLDVTGYYTHIKRLWEELNTLDVTTQCTYLCICGGKTKLHKTEQDRRLIQFLMGLNTIVRGSILMMNPLPTMPQAFSILVQEEKQCEVKPPHRVHLDSTSLAVTTGSSSNLRHSNVSQRGGNKNVYRSNVTNNSSSGYFTGSSNPSNHNKSHLFCDYCKKSGYTEEKCYRLHGFPQILNLPKADMQEEQQQMYLEILEITQSAGSIHIHGAGTNDGHKESINDLNNAHEAVNLAGHFTEEPSGDW
ncbi:hypothetical protein KY290_014790 [Solanum tuberosum]|uniref:Retrotransposon Copia-like N-terminal domain-containing protein n=1 Tax=Solanum tuberosum TaxID=4113 RepID=A0ABQ7VQQ3_SOLTU|nr:hypothetical protein KY284_015387 [Solanum tuberosum]KAH0770809.1 hypothetical protein KY290_014790 [Solanum tuberosum]